jgi:hypothetical protein
LPRVYPRGSHQRHDHRVGQKPCAAGVGGKAGIGDQGLHDAGTAGGKAAGTAPDADDHLLDQLLWAVTPVGAGLGQLPLLHGNPKLHGVQHLLEQGQAAPGGDFFGAELELEILEILHANSLGCRKPMITKDFSNGVH